jgi:hypothetical protein
MSGIKSYLIQNNDNKRRFLWKPFPAMFYQPCASHLTADRRKEQCEIQIYNDFLRDHQVTLKLDRFLFVDKIYIIYNKWYCWILPGHLEVNFYSYFNARSLNSAYYRHNIQLATTMYMFNDCVNCWMSNIYKLGKLHINAIYVF